ncbi:hypothetical protein imdm_555 [gamma proteobacterium IMCC2047]|nr:hypothetical protein imdm_555 [gamma proteobacterium IMCC2047]
MHESLSYSCQEKPLTALLVQNWLASCGGLFKNSSVGADFFIDVPKYFEWSWVAFKLCSAKKKLRFLDDATFKVNDTDGSLSKDRENTEAFIDFTTRMLEHSEDLGIQSGLKNRLGAAYHAAADQALQEGEKRRAWYYHLRSLNTFSNFKFLPFTRYLF